MTAVAVHAPRRLAVPQEDDLHNVNLRDIPALLRPAPPAHGDPQPHGGPLQIRLSTRATTPPQGVEVGLRRSRDVPGRSDSRRSRVAFRPCPHRPERASSTICAAMPCAPTGRSRCARARRPTGISTPGRRPSTAWSSVGRSRGRRRPAAGHDGGRRAHHGRRSHRGGDCDDRPAPESVLDQDDTKGPRRRGEDRGPGRPRRPGRGRRGHHQHRVGHGRGGGGAGGLRHRCGGGGGPCRPERRRGGTPPRRARGDPQRRADPGRPGVG